MPLVSLFPGVHPLIEYPINHLLSKLAFQETGTGAVVPDPNEIRLPTLFCLATAPSIIFANKWVLSSTSVPWFFLLTQLVFTSLFAPPNQSLSP